MINIYEIEKDYEQDDIEDLWVDDFRIYNIKRILNNASIVPILDKRIFLLYLEMGSLRKTEAVCGISHVTINEIYRRTLNIINNELKKYNYGI